MSSVGSMVNFKSYSKVQILSYQQTTPNQRYIYFIKDYRLSKNLVKPC